MNKIPSKQKTPYFATGKHSKNGICLGALNLPIWEFSPEFSTEIPELSTENESYPQSYPQKIPNYPQSYPQKIPNYPQSYPQKNQIPNMCAATRYSVGKFKFSLFPQYLGFPYFCLTPHPICGIIIAYQKEEGFPWTSAH